ncbi:MULTISPECIES: hypothetical protein [unclassified Lysobacter]|uniref:hypothetical protein n=1 Tax=unclassified Lysobacter TaxID=2635362 RepID=UPI0006FA3C6A|nr:MULTISPECIES: hypothetical protein [unclassified Lysobacter]KRC31535.1 hypothetical protein ASE10_17570 [Lysobacter sp. Root76]KRD65442.1 hypothetical protein ASE45_18765 [Lysobacter sp. Root96]
MKRLLAIAIWTVASLAHASEAAPQAASSACFPAQIGDLQAQTYPPEVHNAMRQHRAGKVFGYNAPAYHTAVTVYLLDKTQAASVDQEFLGAESQIAALHPDAESAMSGPVKLPFPGQSVEGRFRLYLWTEDHDDVGSILWLGQTTNRVVKIRLSYVRPEADDQATAAMQHALAALRDVAKHICEPGQGRPAGA